MAKKQKSTAAFLKNFLESDPRMQGLKQAFVVAALDIYAKECLANVTDNNPMKGFVSDELWHSIADEMNKGLSTQFG